MHTAVFKQIQTSFPRHSSTRIPFIGIIKSRPSELTRPPHGLCHAGELHPSFQYMSIALQLKYKTVVLIVIWCCCDRCCCCDKCCYCDCCCWRCCCSSTATTRISHSQALPLSEVCNDDFHRRLIPTCL